MSAKNKMLKQAQKSICHLSLGCNDLSKMIEFYRAVLATLDIEQVAEHSAAVAFGKGYPTFWLQKPFNDQKATVGNGSHIGFMSTSKSQVENFYKTALAMGGRCNGKPGPRKDYGDAYYGCFIIDPEGHRIEASFWDFELAEALKHS
ncbi:VOC family protein [Thalassotalea litorea]|uniref:VOC family protein n=1 Tax=Thalassotalea litorea TaxID=2020715 RepID=A0A5R9IZE4_9GAMM|nr:VOC family protein [Thalassotalea litorea]TLU67288.1 VOC family protein [Thalassotalea litorea]